MSTGEERAVEVLVLHQRLSMAACGCGWSELGKSHAEHQARMLVEAGVIVGAS